VWRVCRAKPGPASSLERQDFGAIGACYDGAAQQNYDSGLKAIYD